ncbi:hypothetical protein NPIL_152721 [Nephila pilipes]|uniref:Uncharacterized protein n=1 Tax=Nephila pilipes TaxID=299642 RepID=A0A8X6T3L8_NEPPI|nr:hypothetical protein NPIL_152721 [Nephila pilipes]
MLKSRVLTDKKPCEYKVCSTTSELLKRYFANTMAKGLRESKDLVINVKNMVIQLQNEGLTYRTTGIQMNLSLFTVRSVVKKINSRDSIDGNKD